VNVQLVLVALHVRFVRCSSCACMCTAAHLELSEREQLPRLPQQRSMSHQSAVLGRVFPVDSTTITLPRIFHSLVSAVRHPQLSGDTAHTACTGLVSVTCSFARSPWVHCDLRVQHTNEWRRWQLVPTVPTQHRPSFTTHLFVLISHHRVLHCVTCLSLRSMMSQHQLQQQLHGFCRPSVARNLRPAHSNCCARVNVARRSAHRAGHSADHCSSQGGWPRHPSAGHRPN